MSDLHTQAALIWAQAHAGAQDDPVRFGHQVAVVARTSLASYHHAGDERATAAALAALSIRPEVLQAIAQLSSLCLPQSAGDTRQTNPAGAEGSGV